jgi:hypothetical protein
MEADEEAATAADEATAEGEEAGTAAEEATAEGEEAATAADEEAAVAATDEVVAEATATEDATDTSHPKWQLYAANNSPRNFLFLFSWLLLGSMNRFAYRKHYSGFDIVRISSRSFFGKRLDWTV